MKTFFTLAVVIICCANVLLAQNVGINSDGTAPHSSAMLDVKSNSSGILIPRMTEVQRDGISSPATGLLIFQTNGTPGFYYYNGTAWTLIGTGSDSETDPVFSAWDKTTGISITESQISDLAMYLTTETDPIYSAWDKDYNDLINTPSIVNSQWTTTGSDIYYSTGKVGFGTSTPGYQLHLKSTTASAYGMIESSASHAGLLMKSSFGTDAILKSDATTGNVFLEVPSGTPRFAVDQTNGYVGIGTTTPTYKLDVNGSINGTSVLINGIAVASSTDTYWETAGSGKIYYNSGNVGIGNATPAYPLDVTGDVNITGNFRVNGTPLTGTGTVTSVAAGNGMNFTTITGSGSVALGTPSSLTNGTTNNASGTTHSHAITTQLPSGTTAGILLQSGTKTAGGFYGEAIAPSNTTRANYDGYLYATRFYGDGSGLTGIAATSSTTATNLAGGSAGTIPYQSAAGTTAQLAAGTSGYLLKSNGAAAPSWLSSLPVTNGGTGSTTAAAARTNLGATTLGSNMFTLTNPTAITFPRFNADNTVSALSAADFRTAIGAGTGGGTVTSVTGTSPISVATGTTTPAISLGTVPVTNGGTGSTAAPSQGGVIYATSTSAYASTAAGTSGQVLTSNGTSAPGWSSTASIGVSPVGSIMIWAGSTAPTGWLLCDGTAFTTAAYPALYAVIGTTYGTGIGFLVPNLKGKIPVGLDATQTEFNTRGESGGEKTHLLTTTEIPSHTHPYTAPENSPYNNLVKGDGSGTINTRPLTQSGTTSATGGGDAHNNLQPYIVMYYIIKY